MNANVVRGVLVALTVVLIGASGSVYGQAKSGGGGKSSSDSSKAPAMAPPTSGTGPAIIRRGDTSGAKNDASSGIAPRGDPFGIAPTSDPFPIARIGNDPPPGLIGPPIIEPAAKKKPQPNPGTASVAKSSKTKVPRPVSEPSKKSAKPSGSDPAPQTDPISWDKPSN